MADRHEKREITIFKAFAKIANLKIIMNSIKKNTPPEPDIQCRLNDLSYLSFELVEIIDRNFANLLGKCYNTGNKLRDYYLSLPKDLKDKFDKLYSNGMIFPRFKNSLILRQRINLFPKIFDCLLSLDYQFDGDACKDVPEFKGKLEWISVSRGSFKGPIFDQPFAGPIGVPIIKALDSKFKKNYPKKNTLHLLAYINLNPMFPDFIWFDDTKNFIRNSQKKSQFDRVWIFDFQQSAIKFVYP